MALRFRIGPSHHLRLKQNYLNFIYKTPPGDEFAATQINSNIYLQMLGGFAL